MPQLDIRVERPAHRGLDRELHALRLLAGLALALPARRLGMDELARARDLEVARRARVADLLDCDIVAEFLLEVSISPIAVSAALVL